MQSFHVILRQVDDVIPVLTSNGLRVQEGVRKIVTEFNLKAVDLDTKVDQGFVFLIRLKKSKVIFLFRLEMGHPIKRKRPQIKGERGSSVAHSIELAAFRLNVIGLIPILVSPFPTAWVGVSLM